MESARFGSERVLRCMECHRLDDEAGLGRYLFRRNDGRVLCRRCLKRSSERAG